MTLGWLPVLASPVIEEAGTSFYTPHVSLWPRRGYSSLGRRAGRAVGRRKRQDDA